MPKSPAYSNYARDFIADTQHLTLAEVGAYKRLLDTAWLGVGGLPQGYIFADDRRLARVAGATEAEWSAVRGAVMELFQFEEALNAYSHKRLLAELDKQRERSKTASDSSHIRWEREKARKAGDTAPSPDPETPEEKVPAKGADSAVEFDAFWNVYPRKVGKPKALAAWQKTAKARPPLAALLDALILQSRSPGWTKDGGEFIPYPATWLNRHGWADQLPATASALPAFAPDTYQDEAAERADWIETLGEQGFKAEAEQCLDAPIERVREIGKRTLERRTA